MKFNIPTALKNHSGIYFISCIKTGYIYVGSCNGFQQRFYTVGLIRKVNGKRLIDIHVKISTTSGYTKQITVTQLNKMLKLT